jgi:hypothetical protein
MPDVRYKGPPPQQRLSDRLKNSGGDLPADVRTKHGDGARRTFTNIHHAGMSHNSTSSTKNANDTASRSAGPWASPKGVRE